MFVRRVGVFVRRVGVFVRSGGVFVRMGGVFLRWCVFEEVCSLVLLVQFPTSSSLSPPSQGKLELEMELMTVDEHKMKPGVGREEPNENPHLSPPK